VRVGGLVERLHNRVDRRRADLLTGLDELEEIVDDAIAENGATSMRDFGRVMADVMPQVSGRADGSVVSQLVKEKLA